ncbi:PRA1 (Prenylated rab acceptor) family protein [Striga asiatica]|uniref:PRA1 family protein n=1 Tax=Striga asiatica TaxID=4170 RepID=A0A5A7P7S7_STRAF|nr:PRA1 (Prenylated rab acceptor) family protein [Striga asiatica]
MKFGQFDDIIIASPNLVYERHLMQFRFNPIIEKTLAFQDADDREFLDTNLTIFPPKSNHISLDLSWCSFLNASHSPAGFEPYNEEVNRRAAHPQFPHLPPLMLPPPSLPVISDLLLFSAHGPSLFTQNLLNLLVALVVVAVFVLLLTHATANVLGALLIGVAVVLVHVAMRRTDDFLADEDGL